MSRRSGFRNRSDGGTGVGAVLQLATGGQQFLDNVRLANGETLDEAPLAPATA